ncbi:MAG: DUF1571 domain-containing protein [Phycisphaerales bacterium]|nr:DUF1571 domain-containing protein [Phycisphaerales bacterium]
MSLSSRSAIVTVSFCATAFLSPAIAWLPGTSPVFAPMARSEAAVPTVAPEMLVFPPDARPAMELVQKGLERYRGTIRDYRCTFEKQEQLPDGMTPVQSIDVRFREAPTSVFMVWTKNEDRVRRALYVDDPAFVDKQGAKVARVEPAGAIIRLVVSDVTLPIHGEQARTASRRSMDEFGFGSTLNLFWNINTRAAREGDLKLWIDGDGVVAGRPTHIVIRHLPADYAKRGYPDARLVMHIDKEWLLPVAVYQYADYAGKKLLASYVYRDVKLNPGFKDSDFKF